MIKVSVIGATGYAGVELVRLLLCHPNVKIVHMYSKTFANKHLKDIYPNMNGALLPILENLNMDEAVLDSDVIFTSLPHGTSGEVVPALYNMGAKIIDLSGDFRYNDKNVYEAWYKLAHPAPELLQHSVYGMPELYADKIANSRLVGNPGCYTTAAILPLYPLLQKGIISSRNIIISAASGITGAGRKASLDFNFCEAESNYKAYGVANHRHTSEIEQELSIAAQEKVAVSFTPHLLPVKRGILSTIYTDYKGNSADEIIDAYAMYENAPFVHVTGEILPELKHVVGSNNINIGFKLDKRLNKLIIVSALDNLIKGASGQTIQNMNIMYGLKENQGLSSPAWYL